MTVNLRHSRLTAVFACAETTNKPVADSIDSLVDFIGIESTVRSPGYKVVNLTLKSKKEKEEP